MVVILNLRNGETPSFLDENHELKKLFDEGWGEGMSERCVAGGQPKVVEANKRQLVSWSTMDFATVKLNFLHCILGTT